MRLETEINPDPVFQHRSHLLFKRKGRYFLPEQTQPEEPWPGDLVLSKQEHLGLNPILTTCFLSSSLFTGIGGPETIK